MYNAIPEIVCVTPDSANWKAEMSCLPVCEPDCRPENETCSPTCYPYCNPDCNPSKDCIPCSPGNCMPRCSPDDY